MTSAHEYHQLGESGEGFHLATCDKCGVKWSYDDGDEHCPGCGGAAE